MKKLTSLTLLFAIALSSTGFCTDDAAQANRLEQEKKSWLFGAMQNDLYRKREGITGGTFHPLKKGQKPDWKELEKMKDVKVHAPASTEANKPAKKTAWWNRIVQTTKAHPIWWKSGASILGVTAIVAGITGGMARHYNDIPDSRLDTMIKNRFVRMLVKIGRKGGVKYQPRAAAAA